MMHAKVREVIDRANAKAEQAQWRVECVMGGWRVALRRPREAVLYVGPHASEVTSDAERAWVHEGYGIANAARLEHHRVAYGATE